MRAVLDDAVHRYAVPAVPTSQPGCELSVADQTARKVVTAA